MSNNIILNKNIQQINWNLKYKDFIYGTEPSSFAILCSEYFKNDKKMDILELGSGYGRDSIYFSKLNTKSNFTCIDYTPNSYKLFLKINTSKRVRFFQKNINNLNDKKYDIIYTHFLFNVMLKDDINLTIMNIRKKLKKEGVFISSFSSINDKLYGLGKEIEQDTFNCFDNNWQFIRFFSKKRLLSFYKNNNLNVISLEEFDEIEKINSKKNILKSIKVIAKNI